MKRILSLTLCFLLLLGLSTAAFAAGDRYVIDEYGLLSSEEAGGLQSQAEAVSQQYGVGVYIAVVEDYQTYALDVQDASEAIYEAYDLGFGGEKNGLLLMLSMADRDYDLCAYGTQAHLAFTDYGKEQLADVFLDDFRYDDWYDGFTDYISECGTYLDLAQSGQPVDVSGSHGGIHYEDGSSYDGGHGSMLWWGPGWIVSAVLGILLALLISWLFKRSTMHSVAKKAEAGEYIKGAPNYRVRTDMFTHVTESRRKIEHEDHSSGGGGTSVNSGGYSHSSGKF